MASQRPHFSSASSPSRSVNVRRTFGADLVRFGASSCALFCTILPRAFSRVCARPLFIGLFMVLPVAIPTYDLSLTKGVLYCV